MNLHLTRPIVFFDLETTGTDIVTDRIVEICLLKVHPDGSEEDLTMRINPGRHIPEETSAVHGIYDKDVADKPLFKEVAQQVWDYIKDCDLGGFNSNRFDIPMLAEEMIRAGVNANLHQCRFVDVQNIYHKMERRTLVAAYKHYCGKELNNAHSASADTHATYEVLCAQLDFYRDQLDENGQPVLKNDIEQLSDFSRMDNNVDFAGRIVMAKDASGREVETFNFGKYKGKPVAEVLRRDPGYYNWMMSSDFTLNTKQVLTEIAVRSRATR